MDGNNQTLIKLKQQVMRRALKSVRISYSYGRTISGVNWCLLKDVSMKEESAGIPTATFQAITTLYGKTIFIKIVHLARAHNGHVNESLQ